MANPNPTDGTANLKSFADMDEEKQRAIAVAGGKASVEARRKKKLMKEQMNALLALPLESKKARKQLETLGINPDDMDNQMALMVAMFQQALNGNVKAFVAIRDTIGEMPVLRQEVDVSENKKLADVFGQLGGAGLGDDD